RGVGVAGGRGALRGSARGVRPSAESRPAAGRGAANSARVRGNSLRLCVGILEGSGEATARGGTIAGVTSPDPATRRSAMTRFALALAAWFPCLALGADDPKLPDAKAPVAELEGVWQEALKPGAAPALRFKVT